jgi:hypothetical protein
MGEAMIRERLHKLLYMKVYVYVDATYTSPHVDRWRDINLASGDQIGFAERAKVLVEVPRWRRAASAHVTLCGRSSVTAPLVLSE